MSFCSKESNLALSSLSRSSAVKGCDVLVSSPLLGVGEGADASEVVVVGRDPLGALAAGAGEVEAVEGALPPGALGSLMSASFSATQTLPWTSSLVPELASEAPEGVDEGRDEEAPVGREMSEAVPVGVLAGADGGETLPSLKAEILS